MASIFKLALLFIIGMFIKKLFLSPSPNVKTQKTKRFTSKDKEIKDVDFKEMDRD